ncbi:hypothetical protein LIER_41817 [Lithospermum erythrorhizon]|uniref:Reverse transcriptase domain-containing protein n=1 Tax=Lithospermum erythrorhizon TaxID=34254 RepID=A0AAV3RKY1_LITER
MKGMKKDKTPGPDEFTSEFYKDAWPTIRSTVIEVVKTFFATSDMPKFFNSTTIAFIPKVQSPKSMGDFRSISCCNSIYKCITTILANRLNVTLSEVVGLQQTTYVPGRSIVDDILLMMVQKVLAMFGDLSGLYLNPNKSTCYFAGESQHVEDRLCSLLGISAAKLPVRYLGIPFTTKKLGPQDYRALIDKVKMKVESWGSYLPKVSWKQATLEKDEGSLGIKDVFNWNRACMESISGICVAGRRLCGSNGSIFLGLMVKVFGGLMLKVLIPGLGEN